MKGFRPLCRSRTFIRSMKKYVCIALVAMCLPRAPRTKGTSTWKFAPRAIRFSPASRSSSIRQAVLSAFAGSMRSRMLELRLQRSSAFLWSWKKPRRDAGLLVFGGEAGGGAKSAVRGAAVHPIRLRKRLRNLRGTNLRTMKSTGLALATILLAASYAIAQEPSSPPPPDSQTTTTSTTTTDTGTGKHHKHHKHHKKTTTTTDTTTTTPPTPPPSSK